MKTLISLFACVLFGAAYPCISAASTDLDETPEVQFSAGNLALSRFDLDNNLVKTATALQSPVKIYEYLRNNADYVLYYGSRSGSINTFLANRGNDVDLASTLIAMYRAFGIHSRYVVGNIRLPAADLMNWLNVQNLDLAVALLNDQGIQNVALSTDRSTVDFEHVWVEVYLPFDEYRGNNYLSNIVPDCDIVSFVPMTCHWVPVDPSFKRRQYKGSAIDIYGAVPFDYTRYYNAIKNNDIGVRDKNPLQIYEEQILAYMRANYPGKTLEDVIDAGEIVPEQNGILPASLPYIVVPGTSVRRYNTVADHDATAMGVGAVERKPWAKRVTVDIYKQVLDASGQPQLTDANKIVSKRYLSAGLATYSLKINSFLVSDNTGACTVPAPCVQLRYQGPDDYLNGYGNGLNELTLNLSAFATTDRFVVNLTFEGAPATLVGAPDNVYTATYRDIGAGQYLVPGAGGAYSDWSQAHRAASLLLDANAVYKIIYDTSSVPYVDTNQNGVIDAGELPLLGHAQAMDDLTGGLLNTTMSSYLAGMRDNTARLDALAHGITPIEGFSGVASSVYEVEYVNGTPFSILPGGLLIDMKNQRFQGPWRTNAAQQYGDQQFELLGHTLSSLEHEVWQQLTGYDAISTVRGIQFALGANAQLVNARKNVTQDTLPPQYPAFGFTSTAPDYAPAPFKLRETVVFGKKMATWYTSDGSSQLFDIFKKSVSSSTPLQHNDIYRYDSTNAWDGFISAVASIANDLNAGIASYGTACVVGAPGYYFGSAYHSGSCSQVLSELQTFFNSIANDPSYSAFFLYFDENAGFVPGDFVYRLYPEALAQHSSVFIASIRDNLYAQDVVNGVWEEFIVPSQRTIGETFQFGVYIRNDYDPTDADALTHFTFAIQNQSAGGGYVDGKKIVDFSTSIVVPGVTPNAPTFNNAFLTDQNTIAQVHNDVIKTPSTADPVSTVTGNNYHDETDITIKGRGLNIAFTRTYNSTQSSVKVDRSLGFGWTHSYAMQLKSNDYGNCPNCTSTQAPENGNGKTSTVTYTDERGGDHNYLVNETNLAVTAPAGEFDQLAFDTPTAGQHTLTFRNGVKYVFEGSSTIKTAPGVTARLKQVLDPYGNQLNFTYDASGRLSNVSDNLAIAGRTGLTLTYVGTTNHIQQISDWTGRILRYNYSGNDLSSFINPRNETTTYSYFPTGSHNLTQVNLPEARGVRTEFQYYQNGRAFNYKNALGQTETLDYDLFRKTTRVTDPRGNVRSYEYDVNGALTRMTEPDEGILLFKNTSDGLRYQKFDALGYSSSYSYAADRSFGGTGNMYGQVTREQDALSQNIDRDYGLLDQVSHVLDKRGVNTYNDYYTSTGSGGVTGKLQRVRLGSLTSNGITYSNLTLAQYTYNPDGTLATQTEFLDPANPLRTRVTTYTWQNNGLDLQSMTVSGSGPAVTVTYGYDSLGRKISETLTRRAAPAGGTVNITASYVYDALDRVVFVIDPLGNKIESVYDKNGKVYQIRQHFKRPDNTFDIRTVVSRTFDAADRVWSEMDAYANMTTFNYDAAGNLITVTDANGHVTRYEYDAMHRRSAVIDANGYRSEIVFDLAGRAVAAINPLGKTVKTDYDALGRPVKVTDALGYYITMAYDANGNLTCLTDANATAGLQPKNSYNCTLYKEYDELNRVKREVSAENGETQYVYDLLGKLVALTDPLSHTWQFAYDNLGRQVGMTDPNGKSQSYQVDEAGNRWQVSDRLNRVTNYTYDLLNRLTRVDYLAEGSWDTLGYDLYGDLVSVANSGGVSYTLGYDLMHRLTAKTDLRTNQSLLYSYDAAGNIRQKTTYTGDVIDYRYDSANRLIAERSANYLSVAYQYDGAGRLLTRSLSSGAQTNYTWDDGNRLVSLSNSSANGAPVSQASYSRDRLGNILAKTEGASVTAYTYDPLYRLKTADAPGTAWDEAYTYDKVGNRLSFTRNGSGIYYEHDPANRLLKTRTGSAIGPIQYQFAYDFEGNLLTKTNASAQVLLSLAWNAKNQPASLNAGANTNTFTYDARGYRVAKTDSLGNKTYLLEGEHLEAVYSGAQLQAKYLRGAVIDEVVSAYQYDSTGKWINTTYHHDNLQSVTGLSGHNGDVYNLTAYTPFGETMQEAGPVKNFLKYTGREQDQDSGLYQYRARYYDPSIGRFISEDPKGFAAGINFYQYVGANPINANDPSGNAALQVGGAIVGGAGGVIVQGGIDLASWKLSSFADYAGALTGGAAGGAAAVTCGPACAGAAGGAVGSATTNGINWAQGKAASLWNVAVDTVLGAFGGKVAGEVVPYVFKNYVSKPLKGAIGEAMTWLDLVGSGRGIPQTQVLNGAGKNGLSTFDFGYKSSGTYIESKFGTAGLSSPQRTAAGRLGDAFELQSWNYPTVSGIFGGSFAAGVAGYDYSSAAGGYLLYPNKSNTNMSRAVYAK